MQDIIELYRGALAPMLAADPDNIPMNQSYIITASAMMAGMTVGHMIALGTMKPGDKRRAGQVVLQGFRAGIVIGENEVGRAMLNQHQQQGGNVQ